MKAYVQRTEKDASGKDVFEFRDIEQVEFKGKPVEKVVDAMQAEMAFMKADYESRIKELNDKIDELNKKLVKLLKATLEVKS